MAQEKSRFGDDPIGQEVSQFGDAPVIAVTSQPLATSAKKSPSAWDRAVSSFGEFTNPLGDPVGGEPFEERIKKIGEGIANIPRQSGESIHAFSQSLSKGDIPGAAYHLAGTVPILGPMSQQISQDLADGKIPEAVGHTAAILASAGMARPAEARAAVEPVVRGVRTAAQAAVERIPPELGARVAGHVGTGIGAYVGGAPGAIVGGEVGRGLGRSIFGPSKAAVAEAAMLDDFSKSLTGQKFGDLPPERQQLVRDLANRANAPAQGAPGAAAAPEMGPEAPLPDVGPPKTITQMLDAELAARRAAAIAERTQPGARPAPLWKQQQPVGEQTPPPVASPQLDRMILEDLAARQAAERAARVAAAQAPSSPRTPVWQGVTDQPQPATLADLAAPPAAAAPVATPLTPLENLVKSLSPEARAKILGPKFAPAPVEATPVPAPVETPAAAVPETLTPAQKLQQELYGTTEPVTLPADKPKTAPKAKSATGTGDIIAATREMLKVVPKETLKTWDDSDLAFQLKQAGHPGEPTPRTILDLRKALDILPETKAPEQPAAPASVTKGSEHDESIQLRKALTGEEIRASHRRNIVAATKEMLKVVPREELLKWTDEDLDRQLKQAGHTGKNSSPDTILALREALDILPRQRPPLSTFNQ